MGIDAPDQLLLSEGVQTTQYSDLLQGCVFQNSTQKTRNIDRKKEGEKVMTQVNMVRTVHFLLHPLEQCSAGKG